MVTVLKECLNKAIVTSNADMLFLKQLKVFYATNGNTVLEHGELLTLLSSNLSINIASPIPLLLVPVSKLKDDTILSVSFSFINLLQMKSESWINGK